MATSALSMLTLAMGAQALVARTEGWYVGFCLASDQLLTLLPAAQPSPSTADLVAQSDSSAMVKIALARRGFHSAATA